MQCNSVNSADEGNGADNGMSYTWLFSSAADGNGADNGVSKAIAEIDSTSADQIEIKFPKIFGKNSKYGKADTSKTPLPYRFRHGKTKIGCIFTEHGFGWLFYRKPPKAMLSGNAPKFS